MKKVVFCFICLLLIIGSCSKKITATKNKEKPINSALVFSNNCTRCHGRDGMTGKAPNLSKIDLDKQGIIETVTKGNGHMPEFEDKLSKQEIAAVADFVFALKK